MLDILAVSLDEDYEVSNDASPNVTALELEVPEGGGKYLVQFDGHVSAPCKALKFNFGGDAQVTTVNDAPVYIGQWHGHDINDPSKSFSARRTNPFNMVSPSPVPGALGPLDGVESSVTCRGSIEFTAGGSFILRAAQTSPYEIPSKLLKGSSLVLIPCS